MGDCGLVVSEREREISELASSRSRHSGRSSNTGRSSIAGRSSVTGLLDPDQENPLDPDQVHTRNFTLTF